MKIIVKTIVVSILLLTFSACVNTGCEDYHSYRSAEANAPIQVPADLEEPVNESLAPEVKSTDKNTIHKDASGNCLEKPPKI